MPSNTNITSTANPFVKMLIALREAHERKKSGLFLVEGVREVGLAVQAGLEFREFFVCWDYLKEKDSGFLKRIDKQTARIMETSRMVFDKIAFGERKEGIIGVGVQRPVLLGDLRLKKNPLLVVLENVEKPGNLGAVLRSCDAAGVDALIVCDNQTDIYNPNVIRSSVGTVFTLPVVCCSNKEAHDFLKKNRIKVLAAALTAKTIYTEADCRGPVAVVLGSEQKGLSDFWQKYNDGLVKIPMLGAADSLNVSTSAAVIVFEAVRQRNMR